MGEVIEFGGLQDNVYPEGHSSLTPPGAPPAPLPTAIPSSAMSGTAERCSLWMPTDVQM